METTVDPTIKPMFALQQFSFFYPEQEKPALDTLDFSVNPGEFLVLCGPSGCGKSTLLRQLKTVLSPHGHRLGRIAFQGQPLEDVDHATQSQKIGFVQQSPDNQIVTDKVWHELAFGLESLGYDTPTIRRRVAEMASFFGIQTWFYKNVTELSGGQKQLLNLASIMAMQPSVLILDEPTSQLDPIAATDFLATIGKINRELGTTIILTEHRLEDAFPLASRVAVMDQGRIIATGNPQEVGKQLKSWGHGMFLAMPTPMRVWASVDGDGICPITVSQGRQWLGAFAGHHPLKPIPAEETHTYPKGNVLTAQGVWFRYQKEEPDIVKNLDLSVQKGEFLAILGGNGTGKTTSLKLLAGLQTPYRGAVQVMGSLGLLPQNPQALFVKKTVREDLFEMLADQKLEPTFAKKKVAYVMELCQLAHLLERHPYDLSGGEQQRLALAKVLLLSPDILLLDEPTKGLDGEFKEIFAQILQILLHQGTTLIMVSHDIEFCAKYAHRCALFFDGNIVTHAPPKAFFGGNSFYTTAANRMSRGLCAAVTAEDLMVACGGAVPEKKVLSREEIPLPPVAETAKNAPPKKLPWWRKGLAVASGFTAFFLFVQTLCVTDLTALIDQSGMTALGWDGMQTYLYIALSLLLFALAIGRKSNPPVVPVQIPKENRSLSKRTICATMVILLLIPLTLFVGNTYLGGKKYYFIALVILLLCMAPFFLMFEGRKPQARELVVIAVLCAIAVAGRAAFFMLPQFKPVMAICIIAGIAFGGETGFLVGAMSMLVSNMFFSQGPWTPWQMFAMGVIGFLAGILFRKGLLRRTRASMATFGLLVAILVYGGIMNPSSALLWSSEINWGVLLTYYISGLPMDIIQGMATALFLWYAGEPMLEKLDRIKVKYGLVEG